MKKMGERKNRKLIITALAIALVSTTVAYAALQTSLNISGSISRRGGSWGQRFTNLNCKTEGSDNSTVRVTSNNGTTLSFNGTFGNVGDIISCTYNLENTGSLAAKLSDNSQFRMEFGEVGTDGSYSDIITYPNQTLLDDGHTKCWLTKDDRNLDVVSSITIDSPYGQLQSYETVSNLGIKCQYYNLSSAPATGTDSDTTRVVLDLIYVQQ